jgi:NADH dehydrogenase FAD-containing subunit
MTSCLLTGPIITSFNRSSIKWPRRRCPRATLRGRYARCSVPSAMSRVLMEEVIAIDRAVRSIRFRESPPMSFDVLIVAPGSRHAYFGHDEWESLAPGSRR